MSRYLAFNKLISDDNDDDNGGVEDDDSGNSKSKKAQTRVKYCFLRCVGVNPCKYLHCKVPLLPDNRKFNDPTKPTVFVRKKKEEKK